MIKVHYVIHIDGMYKNMINYYMNVSPMALYNYFNSKGKVKSWKDNVLVLNTQKNYEIILEITKVKTIGLEELAEGIGV